MQIRHIITLPLFLCVLHAGSTVADESEVASVNGVVLTQDLLQAYSDAMQTQGRNPQGDELLEELVVQEVLVQEAVNQGLDQDSEILQALEIRRRNFLAQTLLQRHLENNQPSDDALKQMYDQAIAQNAGKQYKARHILLESEEDARATIADLEDGADFQELARTRSTGPSAPQGGDLGWFAPDAMVPPFSAAMQSMEKGSFSTDPVQTQFGWHVILLEDTRETEPPPFEEIKGQLEEQAQRQQLADYVASLRGKAEVE
jgi:peptidyl-prolyl cis-trans isomerase C